MAALQLRLAWRPRRCLVLNLLVLFLASHLPSSPQVVLSPTKAANAAPVNPQSKPPLGLACSPPAPVPAI